MNKVKQGRKNRKSGADFEKRVRLDLESKGFICDRWTNNVDLDYHSGGHFVNGKHITKGKLVQAKAKWNNFTKTMMMGKGGFPDFVAFRLINIDGGYAYAFPPGQIDKCDGGWVSGPLRDVIGVEVKTNGYLDKTEKEKCKWLIENNIFSKILIAKKTKVKNRIVIEYRDFEVKDGKKK